MKYLLILIFIFSVVLNAKYCKNMKSCAEACKYYNAGDYKLDRDHDGIPCENVCFSPCKKIQKKAIHKKKSTKSKKHLKSHSKHQ